MDAEFFNFENTDNFKLRELAAQNAIKDIVNFFTKEDGSVAVFDATNSTRKRRKWLKDICEKNNIQPMFLESWSNDHELIINNAKDIGSTSPDYENFEPHVAEADFLERIRQYERFYEPLDPQKDKDMTFIKLVNIIEEVVINKIRTYLESRIVFYVMNIRPKPKYIWLSRHGESIYNVEKKIGGDSSLSERGFQYAKKIGAVSERERRRSKFDRVDFHLKKNTTNGKLSSL